MKFFNIFLLILFVSLTGFLVSADDTQAQTIGTFKLNSCINLYQVCGNCTTINISSVVYPNSSRALGFSSMSGINGYFNTSFCSTGELGHYIVSGLDDRTGLTNSWTYDFFITKNGDDSSSSNSILYIILTSAVFLLFSLSLYFSIVVPYSNQTNSEGAVIKIVRLKYLKILLMLVSYLFLTWFINILINISNNFVGLDFSSGLLNTLFSILNSAMLPVGIFSFVLILFEFVRDINIQKQIKSFGSALR